MFYGTNKDQYALNFYNGPTLVFQNVNVQDLNNKRTG